MNIKTKGYICGIIAAISYGTNPLGALFLYKAGINTDSVLFYRYVIAALILGFLMLLKGESFWVTKKELGILAILGVLFASSSITLFMSFHYMDAGVASTLLFVYPVMVAIIMAIFFKEKISAITVCSILLALGGIALLYNGSDGSTLSTVGVILVMASSLSYALYIIAVNKSTLNISSIKLTFFVLLFSILTITIHSFTGENNHLQMLTTPSMWLYAGILAVFPTVISLVTMAIAVQTIGSTPTAIMGALEPLTAVVISATVFGEEFTARLATGIMMILLAVILIIIGKSFNPKAFISSLTKGGNIIRRHFWWK